MAKLRGLCSTVLILVGGLWLMVSPGVSMGSIAIQLTNDLDEGTECTLIKFLYHSYKALIISTYFITLFY